MVKDRSYDEVGRKKIQEFLATCEDIADLGCHKQKIREDADGYDIDINVDPDYVVNLLSKDFELKKEYDGICISHFLEHVIDVRDFLLECYFGIKNGGKISITVPDGETTCPKTLGDVKNTHEMLFTPKTLKLYLENTGFKEVESEYYDRPNAYKQTKGIFACGIKR